MEATGEDWQNWQQVEAPDKDEPQTEVDKDDNEMETLDRDWRSRKQARAPSEGWRNWQQTEEQGGSWQQTEVGKADSKVEKPVDEIWISDPWRRKDDQSSRVGKRSSGQADWWQQEEFPPLSVQQKKAMISDSRGLEHRRTKEPSSANRIYPPENQSEEPPRDDGIQQTRQPAIVSPVEEKIRQHGTHGGRYCSGCQLWTPQAKELHDGPKEDEKIGVDPKGGTKEMQREVSPPMWAQASALAFPPAADTVVLQVAGLITQVASLLTQAQGGGTGVGIGLCNRTDRKSMERTKGVDAMTQTESILERAREIHAGRQIQPRETAQVDRGRANRGRLPTVREEPEDDIDISPQSRGGRGPRYRSLQEMQRILAGPPGNSGTTIKELCYMTLEQLKECYEQGLFPNALTHHPGAESVKELAHGDYDDYGNWTGSMLMLMLLFPEDHGLMEYPKGFRLLRCMNGAGDREDVLRNPGGKCQRSGKGQNNYRTNLLEAIIDVTKQQGEKLQLLWQHVDLRAAEIHAELGNGIWYEEQSKVIEEILADTKDVVLDFEKQVMGKITHEVDLSMFDYYVHLKRLLRHLEAGDPLPEYNSEIKQITKCTTNKAKNIWPCIDIIKEALTDKWEREGSVKILSWRNKGHWLGTSSRSAASGSGNPPRAA